jgi:hypothetical protein
MALTLTSNISSSDEVIRVTGTVTETPGYAFTIDNEAFRLRSFASPAPAGGDNVSPVPTNVNYWRVARGFRGTTPASHTAGASLVTVPPIPTAGGGGGGTFNGGTIAGVASADVPTLRIVPPADQADTGDALFVIVDPGQSSHVDNGVFEITADGTLYLGKNGAYPQQLGQGALSVGSPPDFSGSVHITSDATGTYPFRIRHVDAENQELVTLFFLTDGTLAYYAAGVSTFEVRPDGTVHIKTGTSIVADL